MPVCLKTVMLNDNAYVNAEMQKNTFWKSYYIRFSIVLQTDSDI